jgi:LacI family transcriptional regulator
MNRKLANPKLRKSVLLAMGFYVHEINVGVAKYAKLANWILDDIASRNGTFPPGWKGDGIVALIPSFPVPTRNQKELIQFVTDIRVPVVDLCDQLPHLPFPRVLPDNEAIGRIAAEHLIGRGFQHFAFYTLDNQAPVVRERMGGFRNAVLQAGREFHLVDYSDKIGEADALQKLLPWLGQQFVNLPKPVAAMAQYDGEANDIVRACQIAGLTVPDDVAVIGADNDLIYAELGPVPLSSVVTNREMIGYKGAELLDQLMHGDKPPKTPIRIKPDGVIVRKSSDVIAVADIHVAKAADFIARHYINPITVDDVVAASGTSRRNLYGKFAAHIGHSIQREIMRQRLEHAEHRLRDSSAKLQTIAEECGFEDASQLSKIFKHNLGISASQFRREHRL